MMHGKLAHIKRILQDAPEPPRDLLAPVLPRIIFGMRVIDAPTTPRYVLPEEVIPGVPWPPGFREEFNRWSEAFIGTTCVIKPGVSYVFGNTIVMHPTDVVKIISVT